MIKGIAPVARKPIPVPPAHTPPDTLTVVSQLSSFLADTAVNTIIATIRLDGGISPLFNGTWSVPVGSKVSVSGTGQTVNIVVQTVFGADTGGKNVTVTYSGGEMGVAQLQKTISFNVDPVVAPTVSAISKTVTTGQLANIPIVATAGSHPLDLTTLVITSAPTHGSFLAKSDGTIDYTATSPYTGGDTLQYNIRDTFGNLATVAATVTLTVIAVVPGTSPPTILTVVSTVDPQYVGDVVGTLVATVRLDGGVTPLYNSTWSLIGGVANVRIRAPGTGRTVELEIGTVFDDTLIGTRHRDIKVTGGELGATVLNATVTFDVVAAVDQFSLASPTGKPYTDRWATWTGTGASITALATGVRMSAGVADGGDGVAVQMWSKTAFLPDGGTKISFKATRKDNAAGSAIEPALLFYWATQGDGTAGHPANPSTWTATAATRFENNCLGLRGSLGPRGGSGTNNDQIRTRQQIATGLGTQLLGTAAPNTQPGKFPFAQNVEYQIDVAIDNGTFTFTQTRTSDGVVISTITHNDAGYDSNTQGWLGFRAMETCSFDITDFQVTETTTVSTDPFQNEVVNAQSAANIINVATYNDLKNYINGTPAAGDRVILANGNYDGADLTNFDIPATIPANNPIIFCCNGSANRLKPKIRCKLKVTGKNMKFWGIGYFPDATNKRSGRLQFSGAINPIVERCEFTGWMPDNWGAAFGSHGHALHFIQGGSGAIVRRCFVHDPGAYQSAEKGNRGGLSDRIFLRVEGGSFALLHKNGLMEYNMFASTIQRPVVGAYDSGQADLGEIGSNGPSYGQGDNINWTVQFNIYDGTGQGGPPAGPAGVFPATLNGNIDTNPSGVVDTKVGGVTYQFNTFRNFQPRAGGTVGRAEYRFGEFGGFIGNWWDNATCSAQGASHKFVSNASPGAAEKLLLLAGDVAWNDFTSGHQQCKDAIVQDNKMNVSVGEVFATDNQFACVGTKFSGSHPGHATFSNSHAAYTIPAGMITGGVTYAGANTENGATFSTARLLPTVPIPTGPTVGNDEVGPFS